MTNVEIRRNPKVVVTGMGLVSAAGPDVASAREKFVAGTSCLEPIDDPRGARLRARYAGLVRSAEAERAMAAAGYAAYDRHVPMAIVAAREALGRSGLDPRRLGRRCALIFSTCSGPMLRIEAHYERLVRGESVLSAEALRAKRYYTAARVLAEALGIEGPCTTVVTACSASTAAIALAVDLIRLGWVDAAVAGGADAFCLSTVAGFDGLKATSEGRCAPFSKPTGLNLGEAAGFVCLETRAGAAARGAEIRAEIAGLGMSNDAYHASAPEPAGRGLAAAMTRALADAGLAATEVNYINAHGTGTEANDKAETRAIRKVLGDSAPRVPVSSTKSMVGHCLGAAGAAELVASIVCGEAGVLPPTANFGEPREGCGLDYVAEAGRVWPTPRVFLNNNAAFGGHNASLVVRLPEMSEGDSASTQSALRTPHSAIESAVCVTGFGVLTSLGMGVSGLGTGESTAGWPGVSAVTLAGGRVVMAGRIPEGVLDHFDRRLDLRSMDRSSRWASVAARLAMNDAGLPDRPAARAEWGLYLSLSAGPSWAESEYLTSFLKHDRQVQELGPFPYIVPSSVAGTVCREFHLTGHNVTLCPGPGGGLLSLGHAVAALESGHARVLLHGAVDELSDRILEDAVWAGEAGVEGQVPPGEGAAVWVLEPLQQARVEGRRPLAVVAGMAWGTDRVWPAGVADAGEGLAAVIGEALAKAGVEAGRVRTVVASGAVDRVRLALGLVGLGAGVAVVDYGGKTGWLEGAQPLVDLAWALRVAAPGEGVVLGVVASPLGLNGAVVFKKVADGSGPPP